MNADILKGQWNEMKGAIQKKWGKLTDDDITQINGDINKLAGKIQKSYGMERRELESELDDLEDRSSTH